MSSAAGDFRLSFAANAPHSLFPIRGNGEHDIYFLPAVSAEISLVLVVCSCRDVRLGFFFSCHDETSFLIFMSRSGKFTFSLSRRHEIGPTIILKGLHTLH